MSADSKIIVQIDQTWKEYNQKIQKQVCDWNLPTTAWQVRVSPRLTFECQLRLMCDPDLRFASVPAQDPSPVVRQLRLGLRSYSNFMHTLLTRRRRVWENTASGSWGWSHHQSQARIRQHSFFRHVFDRSWVSYCGTHSCTCCPLSVARGYLQRAWASREDRVRRMWFVEELLCASLVRIMLSNVVGDDRCGWSEVLRAETVVGVVHSREEIL